jgi:putative chitinase
MENTMVDRAKFFTKVRQKPFGGRLKVSQVQGMEAILHMWEARFWTRTSVPQMAVILATTYHETAHTMQPIREIGNSAYFTRLYDVKGSNPDRARKYGNVNPGDGIRYNGKGYVQLTWRGNYRTATLRLRELKLIEPDIDFEKQPELVMMPDFALLILFIGMEEGWFTGQKLDSIVDDRVDGDEFKDFVASRKIINGKDRDQLIAGYAMDFLAALTASVKPGVAPPAQPVVPPKQKPTGAEHEVAGASAWNRFWATVGELVNRKA